MKAAEKLSRGRRFHEITLDEVVRAAKVGKGTVYRYFRDKDDLFFQMATDGFDDLCDLVRSSVPDDGPFEDSLVAVCTIISDFFRKRMPVARMMHEHDGRMPAFDRRMRKHWIGHRAKLLNAVSGVLSHGVASGQVRADVRVELLAGFLLAMLRARDMEFVDVQDKLPAITVVVGLFLRGARGRAAQGDLK
jgi:AcrR family transcriptional regulator